MPGRHTSSEAPIRIGTRIQTLLDNLGKNPAWLAERVGVSRSTITRIVNGDRNPTPETLREIAPVLGLNIGQLAAGTDAVDRVSEAKDLVSRTDYEGTVRQVIEYEARAHDLQARIRDMTSEIASDRERAKQVRAELETRVADAEKQRDEAVEKAAHHEVEARRYREALGKAVTDVAQLREQVRELGVEVGAGRKTGRIAAILAGVAAAVSVASYLTDAEADTDEDKKTSKAKKKGK